MLQPFVGAGAAEDGCGNAEEWPEHTEGRPGATEFGSPESGAGGVVLHKGGCHCGAIIWQVTAPANPTGVPASRA